MQGGSHLMQNNRLPAAERALVLQMLGMHLFNNISDCLPAAVERRHRANLDIFRT